MLTDIGRAEIGSNSGPATGSSAQPWNFGISRSIGTEVVTSSSKYILILTTGGTIDKQYFDALSKYEIMDTTISKLLTIARVTHPYRIQEVTRKDSIDMTDADRLQLVAHVQQTESSEIVITHGTDTMALTARTLSVVRDKTIVLVGALAPARVSETDAPFNLGMAFAIAQTAAPGVYITMNGSVFPGNDVVKDRDQGFIRKSHSRS